MKNISCSIIAMVLSVSLFGCSSLPVLPTVEQLDVNGIVDSVQCELQESIISLGEKYPYLKTWGIGVGYTLNVEETSQASPDVSTAFPIVGAVGAVGAAATLGFHADVGGTARRTVNFKLAFSFKDLQNFTCNKKHTNGSELPSQLGIFEWLDRAMGAIDKNDVVGDPISIGTTIYFTATKGGKLSPSFLIQRTGSLHSTTPSAVLSGNRSDENTIDITLSPLPPVKKPEPIEVVVVRTRH